MKLNGFQLKIIAALLMLLDHIHQFIPGTPIIFTHLGRLVAPIFIFLAIEGFHYTRDRKNYINRILGFGVIMFTGSRIILFFIPSNTTIPNNIFFTIALSLLFLNLLEAYKETKKHKRLIPLMLLTLVGISFTEGSFLVLWLAIIFYKYRGDNKQLAKNFVMISLFIGLILSDFKFSLQIWIYESFQWMMVFSLPLILSYNGKRGRGMKYLFYVFYPIHIWVLYGVGAVFY